MKKLILFLFLVTTLAAAVIESDQVNPDQYAIQVATFFNTQSTPKKVQELSDDQIYIAKTERYNILYIVNIPTKEEAYRRLKEIRGTFKDAAVRKIRPVVMKKAEKIQKQTVSADKKDDTKAADDANNTASVKPTDSDPFLSRQMRRTDNANTAAPIKAFDSALPSMAASNMSHQTAHEGNTTDATDENRSMESLKNDPMFTSGRTQGFTLYSAVVHSLAQNPKIMASRERVIQSRQKVAESEAGHLPSIDLSGNAGYETRTYTPDYESGSKAVAPQTDIFHYKKTELYLTITENLWSGGSIENGVDEQESRLRAALYDHRNNLERAAMELINAYFDVVYGELAVKISKKNMESYQKILNIVTIKEENGASTKGDVNFISANVDNAKTALIQTEAGLSNAVARYDYLMQAVDEHNFPFETDVPLSYADLNSSLQQMENNNAKLQRQKAYIEATRYSLKAQKGSYHPKIDLAINGETRNEFDKGLGQRDKVNALITFNYNLYKGGKDEAKSVRLYAKLSEQRHIYEEEKRKLTFDTKVLHRSVDSLKDSLQFTENEVIAARKVVDSYWIAFKHGTQDLQALQLAQRNLNRAELDYAKYKKRFILDNFQLMQNSGELLKFLDITYENRASEFESEAAGFWY